MSPVGLTGDGVGGEISSTAHFCGCWQVLLSRLMGILARLPLDTAAEFFQVVNNPGEGRRELMPRWKLQSFNDLMSKVTSHASASFILLESRSSIQPSLKGRSLHRAVTYREAGIIAILEAAYRKHQIKMIFGILVWHSRLRI